MFKILDNRKDLVQLQCLQWSLVNDSKMLLVCVILFALWCSMSVKSELSPCPTWMYRRNAQDNECICGDKVQGAIKCLPRKYSVTITEYFYIILSEDLNTTLIGTCPYGTGGLLPENKSELGDSDGGKCNYYHRRGQLCGACDENYTIPVYSYYLGCVKCEDYKYGWIKFITAAFLPLTVFYILVIIINLCHTSLAKGSRFIVGAGQIMTKEWL